MTKLNVTFFQFYHLPDGNPRNSILCKPSDTWQVIMARDTLHGYARVLVQLAISDDHLLLSMTAAEVDSSPQRSSP